MNSQLIKMEALLDGYEEASPSTSAATSAKGSGRENIFSSWTAPS